MFIIKDGVGYKIVDGKAYKIDFNENGEVLVSKEEIAFNESDTKYTYSEMYRKLNVKYYAELKKLAPKSSQPTKVQTTRENKKHEEIKDSEEE